MNKSVVYPGSFDPMTLGHFDIIKRLSKKFEEVIVLISQSSHKKYLFNLEERKELVQKSCVSFKNVRVENWDGLLVDYLRQKNINLVAKGLRDSKDFDYEIVMDHTNRLLYPEVETLYMISRPELGFISSSLIKEIANLNGDLSKFLPEPVLKAYEKKKRE